VGISELRVHDVGTSPLMGIGAGAIAILVPPAADPSICAIPGFIAVAVAMTTSLLTPQPLGSSFASVRWIDFNLRKGQRVIPYELPAVRARRSSSNSLVGVGSGSVSSTGSGSFSCSAGGSRRRSKRR